jgi:hypothetical protein
MLLEDIAKQILVNSKRFSTDAEALEQVKSEFREHFPSWDYDHWNREIPESISRNIINNVGKNGNVSVKFVIKDLDTICKNL